MKTSKLLTALLSGILLSAMPAFAVQEVTDMRDDGQETEVRKVLYGNLSEKQVYSLTNYATDAKTSGASVDIITREDIKEQNSPVISKLLNQSLGVTYGQGSGGEGQPTSLIMRGSNRVMVTVDGVRIDDVAGTARTTNLSNFGSVDDIERIEVVRGAQGTIAGHTASGGMVAMQTRRGSGRLKMEAESLFGSYGYFKERYAIMGGGDKFDHYTAVTWFKTDDGSYTEYMGRYGENSYNNLNIVGNYGVRFLDGKAELRNIARYSRGRKNLEMSQYNGIPNNDYARTNLFTDTLAWTHAVNDKYDYDVKASVYSTHYDYYQDEAVGSWGPANSKTDNDGTRFNIGTQHNYQIFDWNKISLGYNFETEWFRNSYNDHLWAGNNTLDSARTLQHDVYVNDCINIKDMLFIRGGARMMTNSAYGTWVMPNASAALVLPTFKIDGAKTTFRGGWGMNVNNPTLYQKYGTVPYMLIPNPNIEPERVNSWEAGINQSFFDDKLSFDFGYFNSSYKNYIQYTRLNPSDPWDWTSQYMNIDKVDMSGYEGKVTWAPNEKIKFVVNYTFTDAENKTTHSRLDLISKNRVNGTIIWTPIERFSAYVGVEGGDERYIATNKLPGYVDVNIGGNVRLFSWKDAHFYLQGDLYNLLNQKIACGYANATAGRIYRPGINFRLGLFVKYNLPEKTKERV